MTLSSRQHYAAAGCLAALLSLYIASASLSSAFLVTFCTVILGYVTYSAVTFFIRTNHIKYLPQFFQTEPKKLSSLIWSGKYLRASANEELVSSLTKSYSQLPLVLGGQPTTGKRHLIPAKVDAALEELLDTFLHEYVCSWYSDRVSEKPDFIEEIRCSLACCLRSIYTLLLDVDMASTISRRIAPVFLKHLYIAKMGTNNQNMRLSSASNFATSEYSRRIMLSYYASRAIHPAVTSKSNEAIYMRAVADLLLPAICPPELLVVSAGRVFFRETLGSKLLWLLNYLANPVTVNKLLYLWASPSRKYSTAVSSWRLLLADYGWRRQRTTPLLCFSLQEITPEHNKPPSLFSSRLLYAFQQFLRKRDSKFLDIYVLYQEISVEVIPVFSDARLLDSNKASSSVRRKLFGKIRELYRAYVDPTTPRTPSCAETADEPVLGADPCDSEAVQLANAWQRISDAGEDALVDPDTVLVFERIKQNLENRLQPLIYEFNLSDLAVTVFKSISSQNTNTREPPSRKQVVETLAKGVYKFSSSSNNKNLTTGSNCSLNIVHPNQTGGSENPNSLQVTMSRRSLSPSLLPERRSVSPTLSSSSADGLSFIATNDQGLSPSVLQTEIPDLSAWRVSIPLVEFSPTTKFGSGSQQSIPIYVVSVSRVNYVSESEGFDEFESDEYNRFYLPGVKRSYDDVLSASSDENRRRCWNVRRYLDQFYLLEQKLKERYPDLIATPLPPRSRVFVLLREDRAFYEKRRRLFERFLQSLFERAELRHSRLLYNFLTTDEGFNQRSPGEGGLGRKILRSVLVKSENKQLDPFLVGFQQVAEASSLPSTAFGAGKPRSKRFKGDSNSDSVRSIDICSLSTDAGLNEDGGHFPTSPTSLFGDNAATLLGQPSQSEVNQSYPATAEPSSLFDLVSVLARSVISKKVTSKFPAMSNLVDPIIDMGSFTLRNSAEPLLQRKLNTMLEVTLCEERVAGWITHLTEALKENAQDNLEPITWERYFTARDEAVATMTGIANVPEEVADLMVDALQEPIANKQLLFSLLDVLLEEVCPSVFQGDCSTA